MTQQEYLEQNLAGFENDSFAKAKFKQLIEEREVEVFIETGTYLGSTTKLLSEWCNNVFTIEVNGFNFSRAREALKGTNVTMLLGSSEKVLNNLLSGHQVKNKKVGMLLDAHWEQYNPLLDELQVIADNNIKPVFIAIHDFKVPNSDLGFDTYKGQDYDWEWIKEKVENIYGVDRYSVEFNSEATGARRGIVYIYPL